MGSLGTGMSAETGQKIFNFQIYVIRFLGHHEMTGIFHDLSSCRLKTLTKLQAIGKRQNTILFTPKNHCGR